MVVSLNSRLESNKEKEEEGDSVVSRGDHPHKALRGAISKVNFSEVCQLLTKIPQNGSKNEAERGWDNPTKGLLWNDNLADLQAGTGAPRS